MPDATGAGNAANQQMQVTDSNTAQGQGANGQVNMANVQNATDTATNKKVQETPPGGNGNNNAGYGGLGGMLIPLVIIFAIMWLMLIRPQKKREQQRQDMLNELKKGDKVVTIGGIIGEISKINEREVELRTEGNGKISFTRNAISRVVNKDTAE